jgi:hypothetical protein
MLHKDTTVQTGGLYRCCLKTLFDIDGETEIEDGRVLDCKFEKPGNNKIICKDGVWRWNREGEKP